jgi:murein tripeptide amidase MpaA
MKFASLCSILTFAPLLSGACLLPEEREGRPRVVRRQSSSNGIAIGTGDRYSAGTIAPRGLGTQTTTLTTLLNVKEIASGLKGLATVYGISTFTTPYTTFNGATISGGKVGGNGTCTDAYRVYLNAAIHARERGASDGLLYFVGDLLYANKNNVGLKYGSKSYTNAQVKTALSSGLVFVPLSNPDGVAYDQSSNSCWRKNRNTKSSTGSAASIGVDLNRNFDFLWDFTKLFASSARSSVASTSPSDETYHGTWLPNFSN